MSLSLSRSFAQGRSSARFLYIAYAMLLLFVPFEHVSAQGGIDSTGTGGRHKIQGRIYFPSGRRSDATAVKVSLESTSSENLSVIADLNGSFTFNSLAPGSYTITVDAGKEYELARESVYIDGSPKSRSLGGVDVSTIDAPRIFSVMINLQLKHHASAEAKPDVLNAELANVPKPAVELYDKALESERAGDSKKAIEYLREAISYYSTFTSALNELGVQYLKLGLVEKAADSFREALRIKPDEFMLRLNYGIALLEMKNLAEAETQLREAIKKNDNSWTAHLYLGISLGKLHNLDEAEKELQRSLSIGGDNLSLPHYYLGGIYWKKGQHKRAADELEKFLQLAPKAPDAERVRATIKELRSKQS